jgi:hypothetical protein
VSDGDDGVCACGRVCVRESVCVCHCVGGWKEDEQTMTRCYSTKD